MESVKRWHDEWGWLIAPIFRFLLLMVAGILLIMNLSYATKDDVEEVRREVVEVQKDIREVKTAIKYLDRTEAQN